MRKLGLACKSDGRAPLARVCSFLPPIPATGSGTVAARHGCLAATRRRVGWPLPNAPTSCLNYQPLVGPGCSTMVTAVRDLQTPTRESSSWHFAETCSVIASSSSFGHMGWINHDLEKIRAPIRNRPCAIGSWLPARRWPRTASSHGHAGPTGPCPTSGGRRRLFRPPSTRIRARQSGLERTTAHNNRTTSRAHTSGPRVSQSPEPGAPGGHRQPRRYRAIEPPAFERDARAVCSGTVMLRDEILDAIRKRQPATTASPSVAIGSSS